MWYIGVKWVEFIMVNCLEWIELDVKITKLLNDNEPHSGVSFNIPYLFSKRIKKYELQLSNGWIDCLQKNESYRYLVFGIVWSATAQVQNQEI